MPRLIDADALLEKEDATVVRAGGRGCGKSLLVACKSYLHLAVEAAPTIDAVPVVRCKECKWWEYDENFSGWCTEWRRRTLGNHFCSYGEKRGEEDRSECVK